MARYQRPYRTRNTEFSQQSIETFTVFRHVDAVYGRTEDFYTPFCERTGQVNSCLTAELSDNADWVFFADNFHNIFHGEWFEVQAVRCIKVRTYCFRIVIDDNRLFAGFTKRPGRVNGAIVEFNALADTNRTGTEYDNAVFTARYYFVFHSISTVVIRRVCFKFSCTSIYIFVSREQLHFLTFCQHIVSRYIGIAGNNFIRHAVTFCLAKIVFRNTFGSQFLF